MKKCILLLILLFIKLESYGQNTIFVDNATKEIGRYAITLRIPEEGLFAEEEQEIEFQVVDKTLTDPVLGATPIIRANIQAVITMPEMASMPSLEDTAHPEGIPGTYGLHPTFAHGGEYEILLKVVPPEGEAFNVVFPVDVKDLSERPVKKSRIKPYRLDVKTEPSRIKPGESVVIKLSLFANREIKDNEGKPTGKRENVQLKDFTIVHEKLLHMIVVRRDLGFYAHVHPDIQPDGSFLLPEFVFPTTGEYQIFADSAPKNAGSQVVFATVKVDGRPTKNSTSINASGKLQQQVVDGVRVGLAESQILASKRTSNVTFKLQNSSSGEPIRDLQPYLGALGHLVMIHDDAQTFVHSHPDERDRENGKNGNLTFLVRPPKSGRYRAWFEFQRDGKVERAEFIFEAKLEAN